MLTHGAYGGIFITGIFTLSGGGIFDFQNGNSRWPWGLVVAVSI